jgi:LPXTG-site transpeptidase (sortase) family protein
VTQTISPSTPDQAPATPPQPTPQPEKDATAHGIGVGLILLGVFLFGFLAYLFGISGVQEARAQSNAYATLRAQLGQQVAPLAATTPGAPVAILNIPAIGIKNMVVVEGTSPENLELGPGHVRNTPLPGENGVAEIFGRRATFGAPFGRLDDLHRGDKVKIITGQGTSSYTIIAKGDSSHLVKDPAPNRLLLLTACSATIPSSYCYFDAELTTTPQQDPGGRPLISAAETPLSGDTSVLVLTMMWGLALVIISVAGTVAAARWSPWLAYLTAAPLALAVLWNLYESLAALLPNVY